MEKPQYPFFSSGPCRKYHNFTLKSLRGAVLNRSHRCIDAKNKVKLALQKTKAALHLPNDYILGIIPGGATGAMEAAIWNMMGEKVVDAFVWDFFSATWSSDIKNLQIPCREFTKNYGEIADLSNYNGNNDMIFSLNATTSGVWVINLNWIPHDREGLTFCDATSGIFCMDIDWLKLDVTIFSWQKGLGSEPGLGTIVLSPRAVARINNYTPNRAIPKLLELKKNGVINDAIFKDGQVVNTYSLLTLEDYLVSLDDYITRGGLVYALQTNKENYQVIQDFVDHHEWMEFFVKDIMIRSKISVTLVIPSLDDEQIDDMVQTLEDENVGYDIKSHMSAPKGLRIWCGSTVDADDIRKLMNWIEKLYTRQDSSKPLALFHLDIYP